MVYPNREENELMGYILKQLRHHLEQTYEHVSEQILMGVRGVQRVEQGVQPISRGLIKLYCLLNKIPFGGFLDNPEKWLETVIPIIPMLNIIPTKKETKNKLPDWISNVQQFQFGNRYTTEELISEGLDENQVNQLIAFAPFDGPYIQGRFIRSLEGYYRRGMTYYTHR